MSTDRACVAMEALQQENVQFQNTRLSGNTGQSFIDLKITYLRHALKLCLQVKMFHQTKEITWNGKKSKQVSSNFHSIFWVRVFVPICFNCVNGMNEI